MKDIRENLKKAFKDNSWHLPLDQNSTLDIISEFLEKTNLDEINNENKDEIKEILSSLKEENLLK